MVVGLRDVIVALAIKLNVNTYSSKSAHWRSSSKHVLLCNIHSVHQHITDLKYFKFCEIHSGFSLISKLAPLKLSPILVRAFNVCTIWPPALRVQILMYKQRIKVMGEKWLKYTKPLLSIHLLKSFKSIFQKCSVVRWSICLNCKADLITRRASGRPQNPRLKI